MHALILGGDSFIGRHLAAHLKDVGHTVARTSRRLDTPGVLHCDVTSEDSVRSALAASQPDVIFQLAGTSASPDALTHYRVHSLAAANLLATAAELSTQPALLFAGSAAEYGEATPEHLPLGETHPCSPTGAYGAAKYAQTQSVRAGAEILGLRAAVFRPFNIIGPGLPGHYFLGALARTIAAVVAAGGDKYAPLYDIGATRDYLDVRDAVHALTLLAQHTRNGHSGMEIYNLCSGTETPVIVAASRLATAFGVPTRTVPVADWRRSEIVRSVGSPAKLRRATGWSPSTSWEQSVDDLVAEFLDRKPGSEALPTGNALG